MPIAAPPEVREEKRTGPAKVEDAVEKMPFKKPTVVEVDTYDACAVNGQAKVAALEVIVTGDEPRILKVEHETDPEQETVVVATP